MKRQWTVVLALLAFIVSGAGTQRAAAQRGPAQRMAQNVNQYNNSPAAGHLAAPQAQVPVEELPPGHRPMEAMPAGEYPHGDVGYGFGPPGYLPPGGGYPCEGPCQTCDDPACQGGCHCMEQGPCFGMPTSGQFFFHVDYLHVRANFSEALAYIEVDETQQNLVLRGNHQLDFEYESSYRIGGGYRLCGCGDEIRFLYTRLQSSADEEVDVDTGIFVPFEPGMPPGGTNVIDAEVDVNSYDLEFAKTIPLGGECDTCAGANGCNDCCAQQCPAWDVTWSGGLRAADAEWERRFNAVDAQGDGFGNAEVEMDFQGGGAKVGLEGRRYFGHSGWFSMYFKGDISLLLGDLHLEVIRNGNNGTVTRESFDRTNLIPVTEIELGATGQITCSTRLSAGYLLSAWHDLGFRDEFGLEAQPPFPLQYDDANILGFDGFFARYEWAY